MEFGYLVSMITTDAKCHMEIKRSIVEETFSKRKEIRRGEETFSKRNELLRGKLDRNQKKRMIKQTL